MRPSDLLLLPLWGALLLTIAVVRIHDHLHALDAMRTQ